MLYKTVLGGGLILLQTFSYNFTDSLLVMIARECPQLRKIHFDGVKFDDSTHRKIREYCPNVVLCK